MNKLHKSAETDGLPASHMSFPRKMPPLSPENIEALSFEEIRQVLQDLHVHQVELEMQNVELRTMQADLDAARARYFDLYDLAPVGYCTLSEKGMILEANLTAATLLGLDRSALLKRPLTRYILPDDQNIYFLHRKQLFETGEPQTCDLRMVKNDGTQFWAHLVATAAQDSDGALVCRVVISDITERKLAEQAYKDSEFKYRSLIEHSSDVVFCVDRNGEYKFVNQVFASTFGKTPDYFLGKTFWDIYPKDQADYRQAASSRVFETGESQSVEVVVPLPDRTLYFLAKANPVRDEIGNVVLNLTHATDITDRKQAEAEKAELEVQNRQLQKAESLGRMAGAIAHHFNNQLYTVLGNLEIAMDDMPVGVNSNKNLVSAMQAARKAADVSQLMLTYLGQTPGKHEPIDMSETCRKSLPLLQAAIPKGIILNAEFLSPGPVISGDADQIQQVLSNLTTNAWESISDNNQGSIDLTIKTIYYTDIPILKCFPIDWRTQCIPHACLEVSDNGCGISNKDIEKLFDPFFTTKFTGRGLGLSVVMGIVKAHGGGVTVESEPGRGSVFRVFFPVSNEKLPIQHDLPAISEAQQTVAAGKLSLIEGCGAVLLIEDDELVRDMTKIMLTRLGYCVLEAKDGFEALEIFQKHQHEISCVLSDLTMPRMNGWDTLVALRKISPEIPVILSSGYDEAQVMAGEHPELPNAFLEKPYQLKGIRDTISRVLANKACRVQYVVKKVIKQE